jgi:branched-chain amino acid transport system substrate-binding protein
MYKNKFRRPYLLTDTTIAYDTTWCSYFKQRWTQLAGKDSLAGEDSFKNPDPSIAVQITHLKSLSPKAGFVVMCSYPPGGASAVRQLRAAGVSAPIVGGDAFSGTAWFAAVPNLSNFFYADWVSIFGDDPSPAVNKLIREAKAMTKPSGALIGLFAAAYSGVQAWAIAAKNAKTTNGTAVVRALEKFRNVPLLAGPTTFSSTLHIDIKRPVSLIRITNGKGHFIARVRPKVVPKITF